MPKIFYGITNVYYAVVTETMGSNGQYSETYRTPKRLIGARAIALTAQSENVNFPADNNPEYWRTTINSGYEGTLTLATLSDDFRKDVYGEQEDTNGLVGETLADKPKPFALMYQFEDDEAATRHILYRCVAGHHDINSQTRDTTISPGELAIPITAGGRLSDQKVKWSCPASKTAQYNAWNTAVYVPTVEE